MIRFNEVRKLVLHEMACRLFEQGEFEGDPVYWRFSVLTSGMENPLVDEYDKFTGTRTEGLNRR